MFALALTFAMRAPVACAATHQSCHHSSGSGAPLPCCNTMTCVTGADAFHDIATPAMSPATIVAPTLSSHLAPRLPVAPSALDSARALLPPAGAPLVIELRTLLI
jgi:hypothetical protein